MITFSVHERPDAPADRLDRAEALVFVRDGFHWSAAVFTPLWMLLNRLWLALVLYIVGLGALGAALHLLGVHSRWIALAMIGVHLVIGFEAASLKRWTLGRRGWQELGSVAGRSADECERRFFEAWLPEQPFIAPRSLESSVSYADMGLPAQPPGRWRSWPLSRNR